MVLGGSDKNNFTEGIVIKLSKNKIRKQFKRVFSKPIFL